MKTIIVVRHAKSSWADEGLSDAERTLNERGKKDAPDMASRLKKKGLAIDAFISSPAKRAKKTAKYFAEEFGVKKEAVQLEETLYGAMPEQFLKVISGLANNLQTVALFSHNPGITDFANSLTDVHTDNIPTCGMFAVQAAVQTWAEFENAEKSFPFYDYPKNPLAVSR